MHDVEKIGEVIDKLDGKLTLKEELKQWAESELEGYKMYPGMYYYSELSEARREGKIEIFEKLLERLKRRT